MERRFCVAFFMTRFFEPQKASSFKSFSRGWSGVIWQRSFRLLSRSRNLPVDFLTPCGSIMRVVIAITLENANG
jgi:hypothetical protein